MSRAGGMDFLGAIHEYYSCTLTVTMLCDLSILQLTFTASPAHLKLPLTMESYSSVMMVAAGILVWNALVVFFCILP